MFQSLSDRLGGIFDGLRGKGALREEDVNTAMREIRVALLEADVALPVVKDFIETVKEKAIGQDVIKGVNPAQQVVKIVHDEMVELLGADETELRALSAPAPAAILMVGLQGAGKTTSSAKIGRFLQEKHRKKVLMASLDVQRPPRRSSYVSWVSKQRLQHFRSLTVRHQRKSLFVRWRQAAKKDTTLLSLIRQVVWLLMSL